MLGRNSSYNRISCCFNQAALFSSDYAVVLIRFRTAKSWTSPSLSRDLFSSCCAHHSRSFSFLFSIGSCQCIAKSFTQTLPLGKVSGYEVPGYEVPERSATPTQYVAISSGGCHAFFWTHILYIYIIGLNIYGSSAAMYA